MKQRYRMKRKLRACAAHRIEWAIVSAARTAVQRVAARALSDFIHKAFFRMADIEASLALAVADASPAAQKEKRAREGRTC